MGIIYRDPEDSYYDEAEFAIVKGNTVFGDLMDDVRFYGELALVREGIEKIHEALPDYKYVPMRDVREAMYPEKMTTEQLAEALDEIAEAFDNECKCDKRMSPVMRLPNEKSVLF